MTNTTAIATETNTIPSISSMTLENMTNVLGETVRKTVYLSEIRTFLDTETANFNDPLHYFHLACLYLEMNYGYDTLDVTVDEVVYSRWRDPHTACA